MNLYDQYKKAFDKLYSDCLTGLMDKASYQDLIKEKFTLLDEKVKDQSPAKRQQIVSKSILSRIQRIHSRILLIRDLSAKLSCADNTIQTLMFPGLITYLYLTCFDQLGTADKGWRFFPDWIKSNSNVLEVDDIINGQSEEFKGSSLSDIKALIQNVYLKYHEIHGVKNSFFRFLREVLPPAVRSDLLNSIMIEKWSYDKKQIACTDDNNEYKERWLFETRNNYTHSLFTTQSNMEDGKYYSGGRWFIREEILMKDGVIVVWVLEGFNSILENCILEGIKVLIEK